MCVFPPLSCFVSVWMLPWKRVSWGKNGPMLDACPMETLTNQIPLAQWPNHKYLLLLIQIVNPQMCTPFSNRDAYREWFSRKQPPPNKASLINYCYLYWGLNKNWSYFKQASNAEIWKSHLCWVAYCLYSSLGHLEWMTDSFVPLLAGLSPLVFLFLPYSPSPAISRHLLEFM